MTKKEQNMFIFFVYLPLFPSIYAESKVKFIYSIKNYTNIPFKLINYYYNYGGP